MGLNEEERERQMGLNREEKKEREKKIIFLKKRKLFF